MNKNANVEKYCWEQVLLHWLSAAIILWVLISGFYVAYADVPDVVFARVAWVNVSLTTVYIPIFALRCLCRLLKPSPACFNQDRVDRLAARFAHEALYWTTGLVLLSGVLMMDRAINVFDWFQTPTLLSDTTWQGYWFMVHIASCFMLAALVLLHIAAVCLHQLRGRNILRRMSI